MPVSFARLRIAGFKSFAEPVAVEILPGLTGIVGPNGCGKSNVVEALRWAMGENSARSLRGGEMDDVIFAGTQGRASRNIAEVTLSLEETQGVAPPPFHEHADLEISRKIERGAGSTYRINGREARARDVQTLFADLASGAHASAMVGQGRVSALVNAKPEQRRGILEEAAGITGLHARRHEAELKLKAAEANLSRAEDLRGQLENQLGNLKRQARQASRYRTISGSIRDAEAGLFAIQRARAEAGRAAAQAALTAAKAAIEAAATAAAGASRAAEENSGVVPGLREIEAASRTALERLRITQEQIAGEQARAREALAAAAQRLQQLTKDLQHAEQVATDARAAEARLGQESERLTQANEGHEARLEKARRQAAEARAVSEAAEAAANQATEAAAEANARHQSIGAALAEAERRQRRAAEQKAAIEQELQRIEAQLVPAEKIAAAEAEVAAAEAAFAAARAALEESEQARQAAQTALAAAREKASTANSARAKIAAEAQALAEILGVRDGEKWPPMVDMLTVPEGLEQALGAALGEELTSAADPGAARHWRDLPALDPVPALPEGAVPLATLVRGPPPLARALSQIGLVEDGTRLQAALLPGQALVSRQGAVWRWDGYTILAGTPTAAAVRLQQRNRLTILRAQAGQAAAAATEAAAARDAAEAAERGANAAEQAARNARRDTEQRRERSRADAQRLRAQAETVAARLDAARAQAGQFRAAAAEADTALAAARAERAKLPDITALRSAVEQARRAAGEARSRETAARAETETLAREFEGRQRRITLIGREREDWRLRAKDATERVADLSARAREASAEHTRLATLPDQVRARAEAAMQALTVAEAAHRDHATALRVAVDAAGDADRAARAAESVLAAHREDAVRAEAAAAAADHAWGTVAERILERLGADPKLPEPPSDRGPDAEDRARKRLERLIKERDEMGPVNLRAEVEADAIETQIATINHEHGELTSAIAKLRGSIGHLNREGRERLGIVFAEVDRHFQQLFSRMFNGGRAHLALVGSDDPLLAGLEIFAQPPGKKLATLSLLSGGEQALTALSLIFAVFRCNPAPVCVLDEVDAPLDDANVDRFCTLLEDMVRETATRFLVVTHHPLTMARMDRLYGVTMQERGISRLLSVDLARATAMVDNAPPTMELAAE